MPQISQTRANKQDLNRNVVKGDSASVLIPCVDLEIPAGTQRGCLNTVEGLIRTAADNLAADQDYRRQNAPEVAQKVQAVIDKLRSLTAPLSDSADSADSAKSAESASPFPFVVVVDDPTGNSFIESPLAPAADPQLDVAHYRRSKEQNEALCLNDTEHVEEKDAMAEAALEEQQRQADARERRAQEDSRATAAGAKDASYAALVPAHKNPEAILRGLDDGADETDRSSVTQEQEVVTIEQNCPSCSAPGELRSVLTRIPHFKEVVIMAFTCDKCGYRSNEVHPGGAYTDHGTRITLHARTQADLSRSLLKSDTCTLSMPELELELAPGTLGSRFTTVEGMLDDIVSSFLANPFITGDSAESDQRQRLQQLVARLQRCKAGAEPFTLVLDDPMSNSHIQNLCEPDPDPALEQTTYKLTWEQREEFGINAMRTEDDPETGEYLAPQAPPSQKMEDDKKEGDKKEEKKEEQHQEDKKEEEKTKKKEDK